ncbi:tRNA pseudouridine(38-40) synthase TruA [Thermithiobacillus plumbiphilus]|uniref:tRNA pseudouridine synthase A n=1 Tax=Thermithiobacillus plumbiphilus TaxID=1729899 RepID=A0ABU9D409_9PROT
MRIAIGVEYDGSAFCGWQRQHGQPSVQAAVEAALSRVANEPIEVVVAGRTDTGVHGIGQVAHFDSSALRSEYAWVRGANAALPAAVSLRWALPVPDDFNARFSATGRAYRYLILNRPERPALRRHFVSWIYTPLDADLMQAAAGHLIGRHDFSAFRASSCQARHPVRELRRLQVTRMGDLIALDVEANAFLHHMVRNLAGVLIAVGSGQQAPGWAAEVLESRDRRLAGVTAPPAGLYLTHVSYPERFGLPQLLAEPW